MTMKRKKKLRGLEPDECFWIQNEALVRQLTSYDLRRDPPPDLVIEVDISRSAVNRMGIYAAFNVPEVWRFRNERLELHVLGEDGKFAVQPTSHAFPGIPADELNRFLALRGQADHNSIVRQFRDWVRAGRISES
jgi:Uma2 family endonuclease